MNFQSELKTTTGPRSAPEELDLAQEERILAEALEAAREAKVKRLNPDENKVLFIGWLRVGGALCLFSVQEGLSVGWRERDYYLLFL
jgi:hypothetical protein